jgi:hypothetical protein
MNLKMTKKILCMMALLAMSVSMVSAKPARSAAAPANPVAAEGSLQDAQMEARTHHVDMEYNNERIMQ